MADEPDDFVQRLLQDVCSELRGVRGKLGEHDKRFDRLEKMIRDWQETTATGVGLAAPANMRVQAIETELDTLRERVDRLEEAE